MAKIRPTAPPPKMIKEGAQPTKPKYRIIKKCESFYVQKRVINIAYLHVSSRWKTIKFNDLINGRRNQKEFSSMNGAMLALDSITQEAPKKSEIEVVYTQ